MLYQTDVAKVACYSKKKITQCYKEENEIGNIDEKTMTENHHMITRGLFIDILYSAHV